MSRNLRVGLVAAVAIALFMAGTFLIGQEQRLWDRTVSYEIRFRRTNGLRRGAPVSLSGVDIGSVRHVSFPEDPDASYIAVDVEVVDEAVSRIRTSTVAQIATIGVLGDKYVELSAGSPTDPALPPGSVIPSEDPFDYEKLLGRGGDIVANVVEATNSLKNVFGAIDRGEGLLGQMLRDQERATAIVGDLQETVAHLETTTASIERITRDVEAGKGAFGALLRRGEEVDRTLVRLEKAAGSLQEITARVEQADGALPRLLEDEEYAKALLEDLRSAAADLADVAAKTNRGEGSLGRLVNDPGLYENANDFVNSTRSSWLFSVYLGIRGLFPPYAPPDADTAEAEPPALPEEEPPGR